ncbi:MAG: NAD-dependent epimerase/dehydratase family protein [Planctomycetota bacterium]
MNVLVTGATGFVGRHLIPQLLDRGHHVVATARNETTARSRDWFDHVEFRSFDLKDADADAGTTFGDVDAVAHLAWGNLNNFKSSEHFASELPASFRFLRSIIASGCHNVLVAGTCLEYGLQCGELVESLPTNPTTPYGLAKDCLQRFLQQLKQEIPFDLTWTRLFYMFGPGQNEKSLIPLLRSAVERGDDCFAMSGGEQIRDFLAIENVAEHLRALLTLAPGSGVLNVCSGEPTSVRRFVESQLRSWGRDIRLNLGVYPYPDYEPLAFWGDTTKLHSVRATA